MNVQTANTLSLAAALETARQGSIAARPAGSNARANHSHRERAFGVGYGSSSGYASAKRYSNDWALPQFRCA